MSTSNGSHAAGAGLVHRARLFFRSPGGNLVSYFIVLLGALIVAYFFVPWFRQILITPSAAPPGMNAMEGIDALDHAAEQTSAEAAAMFEDSISRTLILGATALIGALIFAAPIVRIYTVIMRQEGYDRSFVRMLAGLPVVVAGVVQVVRGDLALAFALAGIVAAVRFRTTVKDLQNAVFAFAAIGIGLASGSGSFTLAALLSAIFSLLAYAMWKLNVGGVEPSLSPGHGGIFLSEALVPGVTQKPVVVGDASAVSRLDADAVSELQDPIDRLADFVRADALRKKGKYNTLMLVYTEEPGKAASLVEVVLEKHAVRWVKVDVINCDEKEDGKLCVLEYLLRLKGKVDVGTMIHSLGAGVGHILRAVEMKPMKGLRKRIT
jgi:hypothetical protein